MKREFLTTPNVLDDHDFSHGEVQQIMMCMGLNGLNQQRHKYGCIPNSKCQKCSQRSEDHVHYFLKCPTYAAQRRTQLAGLNDISQNLISLDTNTIVKIVLHGSLTNKMEVNRQVFILVLYYFTDKRHLFYLLIYI